MRWATTACDWVVLAAGLVIAACGSGGGDGDAGTDPLADVDPCLTPPEVTLDSVTVDGSAGTTVGAVTVDLQATVTNPTGSAVRVLGWIYECRYLSPDESFVRGSATSEQDIAPGATWVLEETGSPPGVVSWHGTPTGDGIVCHVELLYTNTACTGSPPEARAYLTGSGGITVVGP